MASQSCLARRTRPACVAPCIVVLQSRREISRQDKDRRLPQADSLFEHGETHHRSNEHSSRDWTGSKSTYVGYLSQWGNIRHHRTSEDSTDKRCDPNWSRDVTRKEVRGGEIIFCCACEASSTNQPSWHVQREENLGHPMD